MLTLQAMFILYQRAFLSQQDTAMVRQIEEHAKQLGKACEKGTKAEVEEANARMVEGMKILDVMGKMKTFEQRNNQNPEFQVFLCYMRMVMEMMLFIRAVQTGDRQLHLTSLQLFTKYFFAHDRLNYARMIPLYLAEMQTLQQSDPEIYEGFLKGNWVVNMNLHVPFCGLGADHALEQINRSMKVSGGLVGITLNPSAHTKFFLIAPELARLAEEAKEGTHHHTLTTSVISRKEKNIAQLVKTIGNFANPFTQENDELFNLVTKVVAPEKVKKDLVGQSGIGEKLFETFVKDRVQSGKFGIWTPMKKRKLQTWKTMGKKIKLSISGQTIELQEDWNLFVRMLVICKSRPEIDIREAVGTYEFTVVPRSMFGADGEILHCSAKSALMHILEKLPNSPEERITAAPESEDHEEGMSVSIIDAMVEVQSLDKPEWIKNCSHLADNFTCRIFEKYGYSDEIRLIFDRYDLPSSLKEATRLKRQGNQDKIYYRITSTTHIAKVTMKKLLSHTKTKKDLAEYLAKTIELAEGNESWVVVAYKKDMVYLMERLRSGYTPQTQMLPEYSVCYRSRATSPCN